VLALAAVAQAVGDVRGGTVATIAGAGFLLAARAAVASGATTSEAALSSAASDDARCRFCGGANLENDFSLEGRQRAARASSQRVCCSMTTHVFTRWRRHRRKRRREDVRRRVEIAQRRRRLGYCAPRRVLATAVGVVGGATTVTVDGSGLSVSETARRHSYARTRPRSRAVARHKPPRRARCLAPA